MVEKRKRITLNCEDMPDEIYNILNEKALRRKITPYIIEIVQQRLMDKLVLEKLEAIEVKIDGLASGNIKVKSNNNEEEKTLKEGMFVKANTIIGEIDEEDNMSYDF